MAHVNSFLTRESQKMCLQNIGHFAQNSICYTDVTDYCIHQHHYCDVIMGAVASQITSLTIVYSTVYPDTDQRKHQSSALLAFGTSEFPAQMASNAENVSIWWRHHGTVSKLSIQAPHYGYFVKNRPPVTGGIAQKASMDEMVFMTWRLHVSVYIMVLVC